MACEDRAEARAVGLEVSKVSSGWLRTYHRISDLMDYPPRCTVVGIILATRDDAEQINRSLERARSRWPGRPLVLVADSGGGEHELAARRNSACFLTRPVIPAQWQAIVAHAIGLEQVAGRREQSQLGLATS